MNTTDILKVIASGILLFVIWQLIRKYVLVSGTEAQIDNFINNQNIPSAAPTEMDQPAIEQPREIVASGPNSPDQNMKVRRVMAEEEPNDPYSENTEYAHAPENLRHPEGMFRPAPEMGDHRMAAESGIASHILNASNEQMQQFKPEFAQNGGSFMDGVMANDGALSVGYSMF